MIEFNVYKPTAVGDLFNVAPDKSPWESTEKYVRKGSIWVPNRIKTLNTNEILNPKNQKVASFFAKGSASNHGIYVMSVTHTTSGAATSNCRSSVLSATTAGLPP